MKEQLGELISQQEPFLFEPNQSVELDQAYVLQKKDEPVIKCERMILAGRIFTWKC